MSLLPTSSLGQWWGHILFHFCKGKLGYLEDMLKSWDQKSTQAYYNARTLMLLWWCGFEMLIWRFPYCCLLPVGGVGVNCNVWAWTLIHIYWDWPWTSGDPPHTHTPPSNRSFLSTTHPFKPPSCGSASSWLQKSEKTLACSSPCCCCCLASPTYSSPCEGPIAAGEFV